VWTGRVVAVPDITSQTSSTRRVVCDQRTCGDSEMRRRPRTLVYIIIIIIRKFITRTCSLVGTGSVVPVVQATDGSTRFVTTPATSPRRYGDQLFFVAMAQE